MPVKSLKRVIFLLFCLLVMQGVRGQVTLVEWNFPVASSDLIADGGVPANINEVIVYNGVGGISYPGGATTNSISATGWDNGINTKSWEIHLTTSGYTSISVSSKQRSSNKGPKNFKIIYSIDNGASWTDVPSATINVADNWTTGVISNVSLPVNSANLVHLRIRWVVTSTVSVDNTTILSTGTSRIDDIVVKGNVASCLAPTTQVQNITGTASGTQSMVMNWTNGNGDGRIIKINTANSFTNPTDGVDNPGNAVYAGSGEQIVYNGSGNNVTVTGLEPCVTYWVRAYEYNCSGVNIKYNVATAANNPASVSISTVGGGTTTLASENFEGTTNWAYTHVASIVGTGGSGVSSLSIKNPPFGFSNSKALVKSHTADNSTTELSSIEEITFNQVTIPAGSTGINLSFRVASLNSTGGLVTGPPSNVGAGHDAGDFFQLQLNLNASSWNTCFTQYGSSDLLFPYLPETPLTPTWNQNANLTTPLNQYNKFSISIPDGTTSVTLKYFLRNNRIGENWCLDEMLLQATTPGVNTLPAVYTILGNSSFCAGSSGTLISLSGSEAGVSYQIYLNGVPVGSPVAGTGSAINFGYQNQAGTYTVIATNSTYTNCQSTMAPPLVVTITPAPSVTNVLTTPASCGFNNGTITVTASGGTPPYQYSINNGVNYQVSNFFNSLSAGTYLVVVKGAAPSSCVSDPPYSAVVNLTGSTMTASITSQTNVACHGASTGSATVQATNGNSPYNYSWNTSPVQTGPTATNLAAGTYICTITDALGCSISISVEITEPLSSLSGGIVSQTDVACFGQSTGQAEVAANGGTPGYTYVWNTSPVQNGPIATNLAAGTYNCRVTDLNGCFIDIPITISGPALALSAQATFSNVSCNGLSNGSANVSVTGGTPAYTYLWNTTPPQSTASISGLSPGTYTCIVTDANLCNTSVNVTIIEPTALIATIQPVPPHICEGTTDGTATVVVNGGTPNYSYLWNTTPAQTTSTAINLSGGSYTCVVTDVNGCSTNVNVTIVEDQAPTTANAGTNQTFCVTTFNLNANSPAVGNGLWSQQSGPNASIVDPNSPSSIVTVPSPGIYTFRWTISNGVCPDSFDDVTITVDPSPTGFASTNSPVCEGQTLELYCSLAGSTYAWFNPANILIATTQNHTIPNAVMGDAGKYRVEVVSAACGFVSDETDDVTIISSPSAPGSITITPDKICETFPGPVTLVANGGSGSDLEWYQNTCSGTPIGYGNSWIINNPPDVSTNYFARYTNGSCVSACTMGTLLVSPYPVADAGDPQSVCSVMNTTLAANDPAPNTGVWTKVSGPGNVNFVNSTLYNTGVSVDQYGEYILRWTVSNVECGSVYDEVKITFGDIITAEATSDSPVCEGNSLHLYCNISGATYSWTGPDNFISSQQNPVINPVTPAAQGLYQLVVTGIPGGCPNSSDQTTVVVNSAPVKPDNVVASPAVVCSGSGTIELQCSGGSGDEIRWFAGSCNTAIIGTGNILTLTAPINNTTYYALWHSDNCGNSPCESVTVTVNDPPSVADAGQAQSNCNVLVTTLDATQVTSGTGTWTAAPGNPFPVTIASPNLHNSAISVPGFGIYKLYWTVTNGVCPPGKDSVLIEFGDNIMVIAQANTPVCEGGTLNLSSSISGATSYSWTGPYGFTSNIASPPPIVGVTTANAGTYRLSVSGIPGGCPDSQDDVDVVVAPIPGAPTVSSNGLSGNLQAVCELTSVIYTVDSPVPGSDYNWSLSGGGTVFPLSTSDSIRIFWHSGSGNYTLRVNETSSVGCEGGPRDIVVQVNPVFEPEATVLAVPNPLCAGEEINLALNSNIPQINATYEWFRNDTLIGIAASIPATARDADIFYCKITTNSECTTVSEITTDTAIVTVLPLPEVDILQSGDFCNGTAVELSAAEGYMSYIWNDGRTGSTITAEDPGIYWLRVSDANNCSGFDTLVLEPCPEDNSVTIPNAFTPNGDTRNDIFRVIFTNPDLIQRFNMTVYSKWGSLVFESNSAKFGWNGNLKTGEPAPSDMYTYVITYRFKGSENIKHRKQGLVTLIR